MPLIILRIITSYEKGLLHWDLPLCGSPFPCFAPPQRGREARDLHSGTVRGKMSRFELDFLHFLYYNKEL